MPQRTDYRMPARQMVGISKDRIFSIPDKSNTCKKIRQDHRKQYKSKMGKIFALKVVIAQKMEDLTSL